VSFVTLTVLAYAVVPVGIAFSGEVAARVAGALMLVFAAAVVAFRSVTHAEFPLLRAVEAVTAVVCLMIVAFASSYLAMSASNPVGFTEPLDHIGALYFTVTTATTIGFGDIAPVSDSARIVVMIQMVGNVVVIGAVARLILGAAKRELSRR
jgi:voltage-gated potassium channel